MCRAAHHHRDRDERRDEPMRETVDAGLRASDADRQRVVEQLRVHTADGRLTLEEFETRVGEAFTATTHAELRSVLRDLPMLHADRPRGRPRRTGAIPVPLLIAALVVTGSILMSHFAWWLIPVGFWFFGGCGGERRRHVESGRGGRDEQLISA